MKIISIDRTQRSIPVQTPTIPSQSSLSEEGCHSFDVAFSPDVLIQTNTLMKIQVLPTLSCSTARLNDVKEHVKCLLGTIVSSLAHFVL